MKFLNALLLSLGIITTQQTFAKPADVIATVVGKVVSSLGGSSYSKNLNQAMNDACGHDGNRCSMKQICTYLKVVNIAVDCSTMPDITGQADAKAVALENVVESMPKPDSCIKHE